MSDSTAEMTLRPTSGRIIVRERKEETERTASGLYLNLDMTSKKIMHADVVAVADDVRDVAVGDVAVMDYYMGTAYRDVIIVDVEHVHYVVPADA